jgi:hypothetical protein
MQFTKLAIAIFAATALAAPAASSADFDESLATTTVALNVPTGAAGPVQQICCCKAVKKSIKCACDTKFCK